MHEVGDKVWVKDKGKTVLGEVIRVNNQDPWNAITYAVKVENKTVQKQGWELARESE